MYVGQQDPIGLAGGKLNIYSYVDNPTTWVDPFGLECWSTARKNFWKNEAANNPFVEGVINKYSIANIERMLEGKAPKFLAEVFNPKTLTTELKDISMELHPWVLNEKFLDDAIDRGDKILLNVKKSEIRAGSYLEREIEHLEKKGYKWVNQWSLVKCK